MLQNGSGHPVTPSPILCDNAGCQLRFGTHFYFNNILDTVIAQKKRPSMYIQYKLCAYLPFVCTDNYWSDAHNRRKFFIEFASQIGFDPLVAANWKNVQRREMIKQVMQEKNYVGIRRIEVEIYHLNKVGYGPLHFYKGNIP